MEGRCQSNDLRQSDLDRDRRTLRWLRALAPLLERDGPLSDAQAAVWRRRLPALIAGGEMLRYGCGPAPERGAGEAAALLDRALAEARALQAELARASAADEAPAAAKEETLNGALAPAREMVSRSAARREVEALLDPPRESTGVPATLALTVPPGRVPGLRGFNLCFFLFLAFQTLVWFGGAVNGAALYAVVLYALILAPFWWWGGYLLQSLALALSPEQVAIVGRTALIRRPWPRTTRLELANSGSPSVCRECWFEINRQPVHCLTLLGADGRRVRFAVGRDASEHERLLREIQAHLSHQSS
jgi:hypothetical protein